MDAKIDVQYIGFEAKALVREQSFLVRRALNETREYTLTIVNESNTASGGVTWVMYVVYCSSGVGEEE